MAETTVSKPADKFPNYKEFRWYKAHEVELIERFPSRYVVVKDEQVIADFGSRTLAWQMTIKEHAPGTFVIQHCVPAGAMRLPHLANRQLVTVHE